MRFIFVIYSFVLNNPWSEMKIWRIYLILWLWIKFFISQPKNIREQKFHSSALNYEWNLGRTSNSSQRTHPIGRVLGKNYSSFLDPRLACTASSDMVYSKELERDVTTTAMAKAILRLKTHLFFHRTWSVWFFYVRRTNKGCHVHAMCKMLLFWAKTSKTSAYFLCFDIKLKKSRSGFDLVTVLISKQSFFNIALAYLAR